jgi:putative protease
MPACLYLVEQSGYRAGTKKGVVMVFGIFGKKKEPEEKDRVGKVVHYFPKVKAAVIKIEKGRVSDGDQIRVKGHTTDFEQTIKSMQIDHESVEKASKGKEVAIQVKKRTRRGDRVFVLK